MTNTSTCQGSSVRGAHFWLSAADLLSLFSFQVQPFLCRMNFTSVCTMWTRTHGNTLLWVITLPLVSALLEGHTTADQLAKSMSTVSHSDAAKKLSLDLSPDECSSKSHKVLVEFTQTIVEQDYNDDETRKAIDEECKKSSLDVRSVAGIIARVNQQRATERSSSSKKKKKTVKSSESDAVVGDDEVDGERDVGGHELRHRKRINYKPPEVKDSPQHKRGTRPPRVKEVTQSLAEYESEEEDEAFSQLPVDPFYQLHPAPALPPFLAQCRAERLHANPIPLYKTIDKETNARRIAIGATYSSASRAFHRSLREEIPTAVAVRGPHVSVFHRVAAPSAEEYAEVHHEERQWDISEYLRTHSRGLTSHLPHYRGPVLCSTFRELASKMGYAEEWVHGAPLNCLMDVKHPFNSATEVDKQYSHRVLFRGREDDHMDEAVSSRLTVGLQTTRAVNELHERGVEHGRLLLEHILVVHDLVYQQLCLNGGLPDLCALDTDRHENPRCLASITMDPTQATKDKPLVLNKLPHELKKDGKLLEVDFLNRDPRFAEEKKVSPLLLEESNYNREAKCRVVVVDLRESWLKDPKEAVYPRGGPAFSHAMNGFHCLRDIDAVLSGFPEKKKEKLIKSSWPSVFHPIVLKPNGREPIHDDVLADALANSPNSEVVLDLQARTEEFKKQPTKKTKLAMEIAAAIVATNNGLLPLPTPDFPADNFPLFQILTQVLFASPWQLETVCGEKKRGEAAPAVQHFASYVKQVSHCTAVESSH
jgi:hypothetical protein